MSTVAVILAAGSGGRFGGKTPKQYVRVGGQTILRHTLNAFLASPLVDETIVMISPGEWSRAALYTAEEVRTEAYTVLEGGYSRFETSRLAVQSMHNKHGDTKVLVHDAARPLVSQEVIARVVNALDQYVAVDTAVPAVDTIIVRDSAGTIVQVPDRAMTMHGQTPQGFRLHVLREAFSRANVEFLPAQDECSIVHKYLPVPIYVVEGDRDNIKVTFREDLDTVRRLLSKRSNTQINIQE